MPDATISASPLIIGEVLFDHFPDGREVLGGAPLNVAWNLKGLGFDPLFVSAVGRDSQGEAIRQQFSQFGLNELGLQTSAKPTGAVEVTFDDGEPAYSIVPDRAFDALSFETFSDAVAAKSFPLIYHGSLAFRSENNAAFFRRLFTSVEGPRFVDLNIRQPWFDRELLPLYIRDAKWVKLSRDELATLTDTVIEDGQQDMIHSACIQLNNIIQPLQPQTHLITCGSQGAYWISDTESAFAASPTVEVVADTVGAGDAFAAATIAGILSNESPQATLAQAVHFAAKSCSIDGATTTNLRHYQFSDS